MNIISKRENEKELVELMIKIYCRRKHKNSKELCVECQKLFDYAAVRIDNCRFIESKSFCSKCKTPCYSKDMRSKIKEVMKFSGPRMLIYHPIIAIKHMLV